MEIWIANDTVLNPKTMDWGIVLLSTEAVVAGSIPDVDDEDERVDWMGRGRLHVTTDILNSSTSLAHTSRDLRAQRVIRDEFQQLSIIMDVDTNGTGGLFVTFITRVLLKMP